MGTPSIKTACVIAAVSLFLQSCLYQKKAEFDRAMTESHEYLDKADFQKAIDVYRSVYSKYPEDKTLLENYIRTVEEIHNTADREFSRGDFVRAEKNYEIVLTNFQYFRPFAQQLSFTSVTLNGKIRECRINGAVNRAAQFLSLGDFLKALDAYKPAYGKYPNDKTLLKNYIKSVEEIKEAADKEFSDGDYVHAGKGYRALLVNYADFSAFASSLSFDKQRVDARLRDCIKYLNQKGLDQYRNGNLAEALSIWKSVLVFDPDNETIRKTIETTTIQMRNLQGK
jgi:tetratricopeptide (TPR) repeat protein